MHEPPCGYARRTMSANMRACIHNKMHVQPLVAAFVFLSALLVGNTALAQSTNLPIYPFSLGATRCYSCGIGNYSNTTGSQYCMACPPGRFNPLNESGSCSMCSNKTYAPYYGMPACLPCPTANYMGASVCPPPPAVTNFFGKYNLSNPKLLPRTHSSATRPFFGHPKPSSSSSSSSSQLSTGACVQICPSPKKLCAMISMYNNYPLPPSLCSTQVSLHVCLCLRGQWSRQQQKLQKGL